MSVWINKKVKKLLRVQYYEVTTFLRIEAKIKLRCNVYDDATAKKKCCVWCRAERYLLIIVLSSALFWVMSFLQTDYTLKVMFYNVNDAVMIIKQAFSIKFINNDLSAA